MLTFSSFSCYFFYFSRHFDSSPLAVLFDFSRLVMTFRDLSGFFVQNFIQCNFSLFRFSRAVWHSPSIRAHSQSQTQRCTKSATLEVKATRLQAFKELMPADPEVGSERTEFEKDKSSAKSQQTQNYGPVASCQGM